MEVGSGAAQLLLALSLLVPGWMFKGESPPHIVQPVLRGVRGSDKTTAWTVEPWLSRTAGGDPKLARAPRFCSVASRGGSVVKSPPQTARSSMPCAATGPGALRQNAGWWKAAVQSPARAASSAEGEGESSQSAEEKALWLAVDIGEWKRWLALCIDLWVVADALSGWLQPCKQNDWQRSSKPDRERGCSNTSRGCPCTQEPGQ